MMESNKLQKTAQIVAPPEQELFCIVFLRCIILQGHIQKWLSNTTTMQMK